MSIMGSEKEKPPMEILDFTTVFDKIYLTFNIYIIVSRSLTSILQNMYSYICNF